MTAASSDPHKNIPQQPEVPIDGILRFLHYYDPQNENNIVARDFSDFLFIHKDTLALGGEDMLKKLYDQFSRRYRT